MSNANTDTALRARFTKLCKATRAARRTATDFRHSGPLSPEQVTQLRSLDAAADAAQDAEDAFYKQHCARAGGPLKC